MHRVATDTTPIGQWHYADGEIEVPVPPLIAEPDGRTPDPAWLDDWTAAKAAMTARMARSGPRVPRNEDPFLLRGVVACGHFGATLRASSNGNTKHSQPIRYYMCACHSPTRARKLSKPACHLPDVPALALEAEAWRIVSETLLNPDVLAAGLEAARTTRGDAERARRDQQAVIGAEIAKHRKTLETLVDKLVDVKSDALIEAIDQRAKELEGTIVNLNRQRAALLANLDNGLTDAEATAL